MGHRFRFYLDPAEIRGDKVSFSAEESHHLSGVLRLGAGEVVEATDGQGYVFRVRLEKIENDRWRGRIVNRSLEEKRAPLPVSIAMPCLKSERWQIALEAACELGIDSLYPVDFKRAVVKWTPTRLAKARRKAIEILKQSSGSRLTEIKEPSPLDGIEELDKFNGIWVADPAGNPMAEVPEGALLVVGPEGGLDLEEMAHLDRFGVRLFSLGRRRLRSEIAAVVMLSQAALKLKEHR